MKYRGLPSWFQAALWIAFAGVVTLLLTELVPRAVTTISQLLEREPTKIPWIVSRVVAFLSYGALAASSIYGLAMTTRLLDVIARRVVSSTLHELLSIWGLALGAVHAVLLLFDNYIAFTWSSILIPWAAPYRPDAVAYGVLGIYLVIILVATSKLRRFIGVRLWRIIHLLSFTTFALLTAHGLAAGTDSGEPWARGLYVAAVTLVAFFLALRLIRKATGVDADEVGAR